MAAGRKGGGKGSGRGACSTRSRRSGGGSGTGFEPVALAVPRPARRCCWRLGSAPSPPLGGGRPLIDVQSGTPPPAAAGFNAEERAYYAFVAPRLRQLAAETRELAELGERRSRNLLAIQGRQRRVEALLDELDRFLDEHGTPGRFAATSDSYLDGAASTREGIDEAREGFRRFDWDRVARATGVFTDGAAEIARAVSELDRVAGEAAQGAAGR